MADRLISVEALRAWLKTIPLKDLSDGAGLCRVIMEHDFTKAIKNMPEDCIVDAVEVVHGRWIPLEYYGYADGNLVWEVWECSECQEEHNGDEDTLTPYCPNCGAKMDGWNEDG